MFQLKLTSANLRSWVDGEFQLRFLAIIHRESFHEEGGKSRSGSTSKRMEDEESLKSGTHVCHFANAIKNNVDDLLAYEWNKYVILFLKNGRKNQHLQFGILLD